MSKAVRLAKIIEMPKPKPQFEPRTRQAYEQLAPLETLAEKYRGEWTGSGTNGVPELDMAKSLGLRPGRFSRPMECRVIYAFSDPQDAKVFMREGRKMIKEWGNHES